MQAIANQQSQAMAQLMVQKASIQHQIQVLTADQRTKADQMREKQMARIDQRLQKFSQPPTEATQRSNVNSLGGSS